MKESHRKNEFKYIISKVIYKYKHINKKKMVDQRKDGQKLCKHCNRVYSSILDYDDDDYQANPIVLLLITRPSIYTTLLPMIII